MTLLDRLRALFVRARSHADMASTDREIDEELRYHLERQAERYVAMGMSTADAALAARRDVGNVGSAADEMRDAARWAWLARVQRDVRYAVRSLRRAPVFALGVIFTIAIALGLNASVFTIFNAYVLRPLAVREPERLYDLKVGGLDPGDSWTESWVDWDRYVEMSRVGGPIAEAAGHRHAYVRIEQKPAMGELVSGNYFQVLGVNAIRGRTLTPDDAAVFGDGAVIVLAYKAWETRFGADPDIVGKSVSIRGMPFTVVGIMTPAFTGLREVPIDFWAPITMTNQFDGVATPSPTVSRPRLGALIRLADGVTPGAAAEFLGARLDEATRSLPKTERRVHITRAILTPRNAAVPLDADVAAVFAPVIVAFLLVLVIACANVANMMLARGLSRQRELGIRMALGASRRQVVTQLLTEAVILAVPAALIGYLISQLAVGAGVRVMYATFPPAFAWFLRVVELNPDFRVFAFMAAIALLSAILFGLAPALQVTRTNVVAATRGEFGAGGKHGRLRDGLVVAQTAACLLLLVLAGVLLRGARQASTFDTGLRPASVMQLELNDVMRDRVLPELERLPQVQAVEAASDKPAAGSFSRIEVQARGNDTSQRARFIRVSPGYFDMLGLRVVSGRMFTADEAREGLPVAIVSETAARMLWPSRNALGQELHLPWKDEWLTAYGVRKFRNTRVVGVVSDAIAGMIFTGRETPVVFFPVNASVKGTTVLVSTASPIDGPMRDIEAALERAHPGSVNEIFSVQQSLDTQTYPLKASSWVAGLLGGIALILTLSGIYGVLAYLVTQRTREIGIRLALGAEPRAVVRIIVGQSLRLAAIGAAIGISLALGVSKIFASAMVVVSAFDALAYFGSIAAALIACVVAAWVPARRAASVAPLEALRSD